ncbi:uncharacterized protein LODBEIA_P45140 [Lodderomyces beijingensis]|uniref:Superoxide dismutase copper/zinc binding domain-containing protein n=1 Tax=Lodderomyces beijingensis TaxID=1775926 RepID=A0ABP0ZVE2_9ASCO
MKFLTLTNAFVTLIWTMASIVMADKAPRIKKNPSNIVAIADFPFGGNKDIKGNVVFTASQGNYVNVHIDMTGFPKDCGPFYYHIHERSVPENGNCDACGLHFNPYDASFDCANQKSDSYCQVGDLSGKHGLINTTCFDDKYCDEYLSLNKRSKSYIVGKSLVFHYPNMTKLACADIECATDIRIQSLIEDYVQSDDALQIKELNQLSTSDENYSFDELDALSNEVYESDELEDVTVEAEEADAEAEAGPGPEHGGAGGAAAAQQDSRDEEGKREDEFRTEPLYEPPALAPAHEPSDKANKGLKHLIQDVKILPSKLVNKTKNHWSKQDEDEFERKKMEKMQALYKNGPPKPLPPSEHKNYSNVSVPSITNENDAGPMTILSSYFGGFIIAFIALLLL